MIRRVRVKGPGVKLANKWCYIGDEATIEEKEYEKNKEYVEVIEEIEVSAEDSADTTENTEENQKETGDDQNPEGEENTPEDNGSDTNESVDNGEENPEENPADEDEELEALKARAKELGINVTHNMKKETIIKKIEEAKADAETGDDQNPEGE